MGAAPPPAPRRVFLVRPGLVLAVAIANAGNAIPFGLASGPYSNRVNVTEWVISALFMVAALGLIARLVGWTGRASSLVWAFTAALWCASASYAGWLPHATNRKHVAFALIFAGIGVMALFAYVREHRARVELG